MRTVATREAVSPTDSVSWEGVTVMFTLDGTRTEVGSPPQAIIQRPATTIAGNQVPGINIL